ncbi:MAG TPA: 3-methyl-2-oxobutanoate hydroxymethyltransferase [Rugosimonospora sp.]|nr:3-methyl-2-oxobutanoate hydroxymethyltransferase [Rugosimonospora sp.]
MPEAVSLPEVQAMKAAGRKIVGVVAWDYQMATIADRVGVEIVSVGDTVGVNMWGHDNPLAVTMDEMIVVTRAVRRGVSRALVSCDFPFGPLQEGPAEAVRAAVRLVKETGADLVKLDGAADHLDAVTAVSRAGIPVFAQFGITPQTALRHGVAYSATPSPDAQVPAAMTEEFVEQARQLQAAGAALLNFTNSGPVVGPAVVAAVQIPVLGGHGGGPWLDGRVRLASTAIGYAARNLDREVAEAYANVARVSHAALSRYAEDVRAGLQVRGGGGR